MTNNRTTVNNKTMTVRRGDIYMARLSETPDGCVIMGTRPVVIISNNYNNEHNQVVNAIPFTSRVQKKHSPTSVYIEGCGTTKKSVILTGQIMAIDKEKLVWRMGTIKKTKYESYVNKAIKAQLDLL